MSYHSQLLTPEQDAAIAADHLAGTRVADLGRKYGVYPSSIRSALRRQGITPNNYRYRFNANAFDDLSIEAACYWLGFIFADGHVDNTGLGVKLGSKDEDHLVKLKLFLEADQPIHHRTEVYKGKTSHRVEFHINNKAFGVKLNGLGIATNRPDPLNAITPIPPTMLHHWFRGLFDGDGCAHKTGDLTFLAQEPVLVTLRDRLIDDGLLSLRVIAPNGPKIEAKLGICRLHFSGITQCRRIVDYLYRDATVWMERKRSVIDGWQSRPLKRVEFRCEYCHRVQMLVPWRARDRRFCSLNCAASHNNRTRVSPPVSPPS